MLGKISDNDVVNILSIVTEIEDEIFDLGGGNIAQAPNTIKTKLLLNKAKELKEGIDEICKEYSKDNE